ncbi:MAG: trigger factor [Verrucomicrobia bacterium]|nr:trigger factor [Verrucomicrobiota bacterium]MCH8512514.1 trigger factor [Kiritimatiellia bacterium]
MNIEIEELSPCRRKLSITVPAEEVTQEYDEALKSWIKHANIPGFRPGRAPAHLVKARHNKDIVERLRDHLLPKSYREAIDTHKLEVVQILDMDEEISVKPGEDMSYSITVDIKEDFSLPEYKGISLKKQTAEVADEEVDKQIDELREQRATFEDIDDRAICRGDMAQIDFTATLDGAPLLEAVPEAVGLDKGDDFWIQADENAFIPELGEGLAGMNIGDSTDINVKFDDKFAVEALRGKEVDFNVTVKNIRARVLPEIDEEFIKPFQVKDADEFRAKIRDSIQSQKDQGEQNRLRREIEKFLLDNTTLELPESAVNEAADRQIRRIINDMSQQGMPEAQIMEQKDAIVEAAKGSAANNVKLRYILLKIADAEKITVIDADLKREMSMMAYAYGMKPADLEKELGDNNAKEEFRGDILMRNTLQQLFDLATISE